MKRIFFLVYELANLSLAWPLIERGRTTGMFDVVLWTPYGFAEGDDVKQRARDAGSTYIHEHTPTGALADIWSPLSSLLSSNPARLPVEGAPPTRGSVVASAGLAAADALAVRRHADAFSRRINFCEDILVRLDVDAVLFVEDNTERDSYGWIAAAERRGIPTTVISYSTISAVEAENAYRDSQHHQVQPGPVRDLLKTVGPHWLRETDRYCISRLPPLESLGRIQAGLDRWNPWLVNTGSVGRIGVESEHVRRVWLDLGFAAERVVVTGHSSFDVLWDGCRRRDEKRAALAEHGVDPSAPLIVVAVPPDQGASRTNQVGSYENLLEVFTKLPRELTGAQVVASPHPNMSAAQRDLVTALGVPLIQVSAAHLLPLADLYVASVSSTIKWALACGVPVIDFDVYGYGYADYVDLPQVSSPPDLEAFRASLLRWAEPGSRREWAEQAAAGASHWGAIDGQSMTRCVDLVLREQP